MCQIWRGGSGWLAGNTNTLFPRLRMQLPILWSNTQMLPGRLLGSDSRERVLRWVQSTHARTARATTPMLRVETFKMERWVTDRRRLMEGYKLRRIPLLFVAVLAFAYLRVVRAKQRDRCLHPPGLRHLGLVEIMNRDV